eukprot:m.214041 g.214041  ORF g.214041 m.214041 type:complete len:164 (-) comp16961_c0_seq16:1402-1893(-)
MTTHKETIQGDTPLKIALRRHDQDLIRFLITLGANPSARDRNGDTPLHFAVLQDCEVAMLLDAGADVNAQTTALGETPLHLALRENRTNIAQLLIHRGTNLHATDYDRPVSPTPVVKVITRPSVFICWMISASPNVIVNLLVCTKSSRHNISRMNFLSCLPRK